MRKFLPNKNHRLGMEIGIKNQSEQSAMRENNRIILGGQRKQFLTLEHLSCYLKNEKETARQRAGQYCSRLRAQLE